MSFLEIKNIIKNGLWKQNPGLVQLLGLCPLLAVSNTATTALSLGLATIVVLTLSNFFISLVRKIIIPEVRIIIYVMIIACLVTCVELFMEAYTPSLYQKLGLYLSLIVTNCIIIGRAEIFAVKNGVVYSIFDGLANGTGFTLVLLFLGIIREIIGQGTIFAGFNELVGIEEDFTIRLFSADKGLLVAILPPGAFIALGLLLGLKNFIDKGYKVKPKKTNTKQTNLEAQK